MHLKINVVKIYTYYNFQDIFLICYDVTNPDTFENVKTKWHPEIKHCCRKTPFILVGTKIDLRDGQDSKKTNSVQTKSLKSQVEGITLARELGAVAYVECSALTQKDLKNWAVRCTKIRSDINKKAQIYTIEKPEEQKDDLP